MIIKFIKISEDYEQDFKKDRLEILTLDKNEKQEEEETTSDTRR